MAPISVQELHLFHRIDRQLFICLLYKLYRDPTQSLLVMALWFWLENVGYPNLIGRIAALPVNLINAFADEAVSCLMCLEADNPSIPVGGGLPLTTTLAQREVSLLLFNKKRFTAIAGIKSVLKSICSRIFTDILHHVLSVASSSRPNPFRPFILPGFPHPVFGTLTIPPETEDLDLLDGKIWTGGRPSDDVSDDDKTMFLTFSRGFPVTEEEVRQLFTCAFGEGSVKGIYMGNDQQDEDEQPLFATLVFDTVAKVDRILKGKRIAKFRVNGKHIWARKYERRD